MRLAISGTAAQGKTTLLESFLENWNMYESPKDTYRSVIKKSKHSKKTNKDTQSTSTEREIVNHLAKKSRGIASKAIRPAQKEKAERKRREGNTTGLTPSTPNKSSLARKKKADRTTPDYVGAMTRAASKEASREKYEKPEVKRRAAQEPVSGEKVKRKARLLKAIQAKRGQKPQSTLSRYATAYGSERIKKEKDRLKTDPVGAVKGYASRAGKIAKGAANLARSGSGSATKSGGDSGPSSTSFKRG